STPISPACRIASAPSMPRLPTSPAMRKYGRPLARKLHAISARRCEPDAECEMPVGRSLLQSFVWRLIVAGALALAPAARAAAAETVPVGLVGAISATHWPVVIGLKQGYFAAEDIAIDMVTIQSNAAMVQQLAAGSLDVALSGGLVDPLRAIDKGAAIAIAR